MEIQVLPHVLAPEGQFLVDILGYVERCCHRVLDRAQGAEAEFLLIVRPVHVIAVDQLPGLRAAEPPEGLVTSVGWSVGGKTVYALEGSVFVAGAAVQWLRDEMRMVRTAGQTEEYCTAVEDAHGVYVVPAFAGLGAPYWNPYARGTIVGISRGTTREHIIRATVESMAYQVYDLLEAMEQDSGLELQSLKVDGGASANDFLMQFQADIIHTKVYRPECIETTALGAAYLAGLATGYYENKEEIRENWQLGRDFEPLMESGKREELLRGWKRAIKSTLAYSEGEV